MFVCMGGREREREREREGGGGCNSHSNSIDGEVLKILTDYTQVQQYTDNFTIEKIA